MEVEELQSLSGPVKEKVVKLIQEHHKAIELQTLFEKQKIESDQDIFELRQQLEASLKQLDDVSLSKSHLESRLRETEKDRNDKVSLLHEAQAVSDQAVNQKNEIQRALDLVSVEKSDIQDLYDKRKVQVEEAKAQGLKHEEQIKALLLEKCKNQIKLDDIQSKELTLEHREKRWSEEKKLMDQEKLWYMDELHSKEHLIFTLRKEMGLKELEWQTGLGQKEEATNQLQTQVDDHKDTIRQLTAHTQALEAKLKQGAEEGVSRRETFEKELLCQTKLAQVYKESADEAEKKVEELTTALENIKDLYNQVKENHFTMQENIKTMQAEQDNTLKTKDEEIAGLKDELEKANELLRSKHRVMLTDEEVAALSPGAAAASKLIKGGFSLTQIYRDHSKVVEELEQQRVENRRLERYIQEIVADLTEKAPILKKQRDDYEETLEVVEKLKAQLRAVGEEEDRMREDKDTALRQLTYTKAELERYQRDNADLAAQVRQLLQCLEKARRGEEAEGAPSFGRTTPTDPLPSAEDLLLFRDIDELQSTNQRLLSALREAEAKREEMVKAAQEAEMSKVQNDLENALSELRTLRDHRGKQDLVLDTVCKQRDTYKKICEDMQTKSPVKVGRESGEEGQKEEGAERRTETQAVLDRLNKEFDLYRKEKSETERMLSEKVESLTSEVSGLRSTNAKLDADFKYQEGRFKILAGNTEGYKKESVQLRERLTAAAVLAAKHEEKISELTQTLIADTEKMAGLKIRNQSLGERLEASKRMEDKLQRELETLRENSHSHQMLIASLNELQSRLDRAESERGLKVQTSLEAMTKEKNSLQQTLNTLSEQQQEYVRDSKSKMNDLETKLECERSKVKSLESKMEWEEGKRKLAEETGHRLQKQLELLASGNKDATGERFQKESQQLQTRLNYLEKQHEETKRKLEDTNEKLKRAESEISDYKRVSETMETSLKNQQETEGFAKKQLGNELEKAERELGEAKREILTLSEEKSGLLLRVEALSSEKEEMERETGGRIQRLNTQLATKEQEADSWRAKEADSANDRDEQARVASQWEVKYVEETTKNTETQAELSRVKEELGGFEVILAEAQGGLASLQDELKEKKAAWIAKESELTREIERLKRKEGELEKSNSSLFEQIEKLGKQVAVLERYKEPSGTDSTDVSTEDRNAETATSLTEVISSLRTQWQDSAAKAEEAVGETERLKGRQGLLEKELDTAREEARKAREEVKSLLASENERVALVAKLKALEQTESQNKALSQRNLGLERDLVGAREKAEELTRKVSTLSYEKRDAEGRVESVGKEMEALREEVNSWKLRHQQLLDQKTALDSEHTGKLRQELEEAVQRSKGLQSEAQQHQLDLMKKRQRVEELQTEIAALRNTLEEVTEEKEKTMSDLKDLRQKDEQLEQDYRKRNQILEQARRLALKYKKQYEELKERGGPVTASPSTPITPLSATSTPERNKDEDSVELKEKIRGLETANKELEAKLAANAKSSKAHEDLGNRLDTLHKQLMDAKGTISDMAAKIVEEKAQNKALKGETKQLEEQKQAIQASFDEMKCRLDLLTNMHSQCEPRVKRLTEEVEALRERDKGPSLPVVQPVAAMTSTDRGKEQQRASGSQRVGSRGVTPRTATIRPMAAASTRTLSTQPDQSSSSAGSLATVTPIVSTTQQPNTSSSVPHAFVTPHSIDAQQEMVSGSNDMVVSAISSSTPTAISSSSGGTHSARKRPNEPAYFAQSDETEPGSSKRLKPDSSEQVSTSDETAGEREEEEEEEEGDEVTLEGMAEEEEEEEAEEDGSGFSLDDINPEDLNEEEEDIGVSDEEEDEEEMGEGEEEDLDEPESSLSDDDNDEIVVLEEVEGVPGVDRLPGGPSSGNHMPVGLARSFPMMEEGDESVVPSTPTLVSQSLSSAHVPQSNQFFEMNFLPTVSSEAAAEGVPESGSQQNVPGTPGQGSPPQVSLDSDSGAATSTVNVESGMDEGRFQFEEEPEFLPGEANEEDVVQDGGLDEYEGEDESGQGSEAIPVTVATDIQGELMEGGDEANEPSTSNQTQQSRGVKLRKPIVWDLSHGRQSEDSSEPSSSRGGRQTARRSRLRGTRRGAARGAPQ